MFIATKECESANKIHKYKRSNTKTVKWCPVDDCKRDINMMINKNKLIARYLPISHWFPEYNEDWQMQVGCPLLIAHFPPFKHGFSHIAKNINKRNQHKSKVETQLSCHKFLVFNSKGFLAIPRWVLEWHCILLLPYLTQEVFLSFW